MWWELAGDILRYIPSLLAYVALLLVVFYMLFQTRLGRRLHMSREGAPETDTAAARLARAMILAVVFGLLAIYSTVSGAQIGGAVANTRDFSVIVAGMLGGPAAGVGAGVLAGVHRYFYGGFTAIPCAVATILAGIAGGVFFVLNKGRFISPVNAAVFGAAAESIHMLLVLLLSRPFAEAVSVVRVLALPMVLANAVGLALFSFMLRSLARQQKMAATQEKIKSELGLINDLQMSILPQISSDVEESRDSMPSIDRLLPYMTRESHQAGELLFRKDDAADRLYYIARGSVELVEIAKLVGEGAVIGEAGIFSPFHKRTMTARCHTDLELYYIDQQNMMQILYRIPYVFVDLIQLTLRRFTVNLMDRISEKERTENELKIAHSIQSSMLPRGLHPFPNRTDLELHATMRPAKEVGGDFYDFGFLDGRRLYFGIGDVSGKGVPAALFMAISKTLLRNEGMRGIAPGQILVNVNNILCPDNEECMFVTVFCGILDTQTGEIEFANAGHNPPVVCRNSGAVELLEMKSGFVLAGMANMVYETQTTRLERGETLLLYTDGVTEAMNAREEQFTAGRLKQVVEQQPASGAAPLIESIENSVSQFSGEAPQSDDITMLALRYLG
jgi:CRP-like cAMP-binding protein